MKTLPGALIGFALVALGTLASGAVMAQHYGHGGGVRFGISIGVPFYAPRYYPAPYYAYPAPVFVYPAPAYVYRPAVIGYASPPVYIERDAAQRDWYYCASAGTYYPYTRECPGGWQRVPAR